MEACAISHDPQTALWEDDDSLTQLRALQILGRQVWRMAGKGHEVGAYLLGQHTTGLSLPSEVSRPEVSGEFALQPAATWAVAAAVV